MSWIRASSPVASADEALATVEEALEVATAEAALEVAAGTDTAAVLVDVWLAASWELCAALVASEEDDERLLDPSFAS
jgi:hypothetical protein